MKGSFKLQTRRKLSHAEARACVAANLLLPGSGSLASGRKVGYAQMAAVFLAMLLTVVTSLPFFQWVMAGGASPNPMDDGSQALHDLWIHIRWPLACVAGYVAATLWAAATGASILRESQMQGVPPKII